MYYVFNSAGYKQIFQNAMYVNGPWCVIEQNRWSGIKMSNTHTALMRLKHHDVPWKSICQDLIKSLSTTVWKISFQIQPDITPGITKRLSRLKTMSGDSAVAKEQKSSWCNGWRRGIRTERFSTQIIFIKTKILRNNLNFEIMFSLGLPFLWLRIGCFGCFLLALIDVAIHHW